MNETAAMILLTCGCEDENWQTYLREALSPLGKLRTMEVKEVMNFSEEHKQELVIIDATFTEDVDALVSRIRSARPDRRIVVVTASPTWKRARAAFEAGAIDYLPKSLSKADLQKTFAQIRRKPLPPWPR
jgi:DNA-binding NtrC family response regulator